MKYSYNALVYHGEKIAESFEWVARYGYDAIELVGEPTNHDVAEIRALSAKRKITASSLCSIFSSGTVGTTSSSKSCRISSNSWVLRSSWISA